MLEPDLVNKKTSSAVFFPFAKRQDRLCIINLKSCIYKDTSCNKSLLIFKRSEKVIKNVDLRLFLNF